MATTPMVQRAGGVPMTMPTMRPGQQGPATSPQAPPPANDQFNGSGEEAGGQDPKSALIKSLEAEVTSLQGMIQQEQLLADSPTTQQNQQAEQQAQQQIQQLQQKLDADEAQLYQLTGGQEGYQNNPNGTSQMGSQVAPANSPASSPSVGNNQGGAPTGSYQGGGQAGPGNTAPSANYPTAAPQSGEAAVNLANSQLGKQAQNVNLANYTAAGGRTNDCADFVSAVLSDSGRFNKTSGDASVAQFKADLAAQGYRQVPASQAKPGDVFMSTRYSHTELVAGNNNGQVTGIGANGSSQETVSTNYVGTSGNPGYFLQKSDGS